jgi:hypothetical protein
VRPNAPPAAETKAAPLGDTLRRTQAASRMLGDTDMSA